MDNVIWKFTLLFVAFVCSDLLRSLGSSLQDDSTASTLKFASETSRNVIGSLGSAVSFPCAALNFGGSNAVAANVTWLHNETEMENGDSIKHKIEANGSLSLRSLAWQDSGTYGCKVETANVTLLSSSTQLIINRLTGWLTEPPTIATSTQGSAIRFHCTINDGIPIPSYYWAQNGIALNSSDDSRMFASSGILQIFNLQSSDAGVYQCFASNDAGRLASRTVNLSVAHSSAPTSQQQSPATSSSAAKASTVNVHGNAYKIWAQPRNQSAAVEQEEVLFECMLEATSQGAERFPVVSWSFANDETSIKVPSASGDGRLRQLGPNLILSNVSLADAGKYSCAVGDVTAGVANLVVQSPPLLSSIIEKPLDNAKKRGETARFHCSVKNIDPMPEIVWFKDGKRIADVGRIKVFPSTSEPPAISQTPGKSRSAILFKRDLVVSNVQHSDTGIYQCVVSNKLGSATSAATLSFDEVESKNRNLDEFLKAPTNFKADAVGQRFVYLSWDTVATRLGQLRLPNVELVVYILHFYESESGKENTEGVTGCGLQARCEFQCCSAVQLKPFTNYTFYVSGIVKLGGSHQFTLPSEKIMLRTADSVALGAPALSLTALSDPGSVSLSWGELSQKLLPGQLREYRIEYYQQGAPDSLVSIAVPPVLREHRITGLKVGASYYVRIIPFTSAGRPDVSNEKTFPWSLYTVNDVVVNKKLLAPQIEAVRNLGEGSSAFELSWRMPAEMATNLSGYRISWKLTGRKQTSSFVASANATSAVIEGLLPSSLYEVRISALDHLGQAGFESTQTFKTPDALQLSSLSRKSNGNLQTVLVEPPLSLSCSTPTAKSLQLHWKRPPSSRDITKYVVRITLVPQDSEAMNASAVQYKQTSAQPTLLVDNLQPGQAYLFAIKSVDKYEYDGPFSHDVQCKTLEEPPTEPLGLSVQRLPSNPAEVLVHWLPPLYANGVVHSYTVWYTEVNSDKRWQSRVVPGNQTRLELSGVPINGELAFVVTAHNKAGKGNPSEKFDLLPKAVQDVQANTSFEARPKVIIEPSYTEGIIMGVCITVISMALFALMLMCKKKFAPTFSVCFGHQTDGILSVGEIGSPPKLNGHLPNGCLISSAVDAYELRSLLPQIVEFASTEHDSKGGISTPINPSLLHHRPLSTGCMVDLQSLPLSESGVSLSTALTSPLSIDVALSDEECLAPLITKTDYSSALPADLSPGAVGESSQNHSSIDVSSDASTAQSSGAATTTSDFCSRSPTDASVCSSSEGGSWDSADEVCSASCQESTSLNKPKDRRTRSANASPPSGQSSRNLTDSGIGFDSESARGDHNIRTRHKNRDAFVNSDSDDSEMVVCLTTMANNDPRPEAAFDDLNEQFRQRPNGLLDLLRKAWLANGVNSPLSDDEQRAKDLRLSKQRLRRSNSNTIA